MLFGQTVMLFLGIMLFGAGDGFAIKSFLMDNIVNPIKSVLPRHHHHHDHNITTESPEAREHGNFDSLPRDILRETSKTFRDIKDKIKRTFTRETKGLDCNKTLSDGKVDTFKSRVQAIYPGTKWCGDGNISSSFDDLGKFADTDRCCRDHDMCPDNMEADSGKYGLTNTGLFTRSHCSCDSKFYQCLKAASSIVADSIGYTYFTVLGPQCFQEDYPIVECASERKGKCVKYEMDETEEKMYQWFDSPAF